MTVSKEHDTIHSDHSDDPKAVRKRLTGMYLSPTVERMFGALVDVSDEDAEDRSSEVKTPQASRPGAA